jgi:hypothetical protein
MSAINTTSEVSRTSWDFENFSDPKTVSEAPLSKTSLVAKASFGKVDEFGDAMPLMASLKDCTVRTLEDRTAELINSDFEALPLEELTGFALLKWMWTKDPKEIDCLEEVQAKQLNAKLKKVKIWLDTSEGKENLEINREQLHLKQKEGVPAKYGRKLYKFLKSEIKKRINKEFKTQREHLIKERDKLNPPSPARADYQKESLKLAQFASVFFSHASIDSKTSKGMPLADLTNSFKENGWAQNSQSIELFRMEDGTYTSWNNRRLHCLKNLLEIDPTNTIEVPVKIYDPKTRLGKTRDIGNIRGMLKKKLGYDNSHPEGDVPSEITALRDHFANLPHNIGKVTCGDRLMTRLCMDLGKKANRENVVTDDAGTIIGYSKVVIREAAASVADSS